jgi:flagellar hook-associated protein 3 FlgL
MRVTDGMRATDMVRTLDQLTEAQQDASNRALTGNKVNKPSDDPAAAAELARIRASQAQADAGLKAASSAESDLTLSESVLAQANDLFTSAREIAEQGANATLDASARATLADQVGQIKLQLVGLANTKGQSGYLFGGSQTQAAPFDPSGNFSGDDVAHVVDLGTGTPTAVNTISTRCRPGSRRTTKRRSATRSRDSKPHANRSCPCSPTRACASISCKRPRTC